MKNSNHQNQLFQTIDQYISASKFLQMDILRDLLHPDARIYYADSVDSKSLVEHWKSTGGHVKDFDQEEWAEKTHMSILSLHIDHDIAHLRIKTHTPLNYIYLDYHTLIWYEEKWHLITKVADLLETPSESESPPSGKEYDEVLAFINNYINNCGQIDEPSMNKYIHPDARIFFGSKKLSELWKKEPFQNLWTEEISIMNIEVDKYLAFVKLQIGESRRDFHELIKIGKNWIFINKVSQNLL